MDSVTALFQAQDLRQLFMETVYPWGLNVIAALIILVAGRWIVKAIVRFFRGVLARANYDQMLINFLAATLQAVLMVIVIVAMLDQLGVATTSIVAVLGAAGLAVGLALQGSLQNFAAGIMILIFRPFRAGDYVEAGGTAGTVEKVGIFSTTMTSTDNKEVIVPNGNVYKDTIVNYSARETRRIDLVIGVSYDSDLAVVKTLLQELVDADERILQKPSPTIAVLQLGAHSVDLVVRPWVKTDYYFVVKCDLTEAIKLAFDEAGISIPFPQLEVQYSTAAD